MTFHKRLILILGLCQLLGCSSFDFDVWRADQLVASSGVSYEKAAGLYQRVLSRLAEGPKKDEVRLKLGRLFFEHGSYPAAIKQFKPVSSYAGQRWHAIALFKHSDFTGALEVFNNLGSSKGDAEYLYYYGLTLEKNNLYDQALRVYARVKGEVSFEALARERIAAINLSSVKTAFAGVDERVKKLIQESPGQKEYPDASGLYLFVDEKITLSEDDRLVTDFHYCVKVLNDRGKEKLAEVSMGYDSTYEKIELEYARIIKPDGSVVTVGDKNIRDVSLYLNFPLYSNARVRIVSMPEVVAGSVIEYKAKRYSSKLFNGKDFSTVYWLAAEDPILYQRHEVDIPSVRTMRHKIVNGVYNTKGYNMRPKVKETKGRRSFFMEFKDVPQIIPEPSMPPFSKINPYVLFSTVGDWQDIYTWWKELYKEKIIPDEEITAKARELIRGKEGLSEKVRVIYNYCAQEIRYVAVEYGDAGYEPHAAGEIFKNKYGDCKDQAVLLISMLGAAGIEAYPVLISTRGALDVQKDLPSPLFNHAIAAAKIEDEIIFMDVTADTVSFGDLPLGDQDRLAMVFFKDSYEFIRTPLFKSDHNWSLLRMKIRVDADETVRAQREVRTSGVYSQGQRYWLKYTMPALIEEGLKQKIRSLMPNAVLENYEIDNVEDLDKPILLKYRFRAPRYFTKADDARIMDRLSAIDTSAVVKDTRLYPIVFNAYDRQEEIVEVELPEHLAVKYLPVPVEIETKWFFVSSRYELSGDQTIRYHWISETKTREVPLGEYQDFKKEVENAEVLVDQQVMLEVK